MAKLRYYAVRNGRKTGIFKHWEECKDQVVGFKDAEYKSFDNMKDAEEYLSQTFTEKERPAKKRRSKAEKIADYNTVAENLSNEIPQGQMIAYIDGSYDAERRRYSYGCILIKSGNVTTHRAWGMRPEAAEARNVAGELQAAMFAVKTTAADGIKDITIYHDYYGISKWYEHKWQANSFCARHYLKFMDKYRPYMDIKFVKVEGHSGVPLNEYADLLAKEALAEE